ncbi:hypothetical protein VP01_515g7 [Puccinia sorghi]|uniref:Uncharacterized protein n=1 Tax=Puccinia sorghi TaxID=27349 RepID=A0A0L6UKX0_9BASI|nr:hypothetical protein VP01_515g7 [Puccinia sorghi]
MNIYYVKTLNSFCESFKVYFLGRSRFIPSSLVVILFQFPHQNNLIIMPIFLNLIAPLIICKLQTMCPQLPACRCGMPFGGKILNFYNIFWIYIHVLQHLHTQICLYTTSQIIYFYFIYVVSVVKHIGHQGLKTETGVKTHVWKCDGENDGNYSVSGKRLVRRRYYSSNGILESSVSTIHSGGDIMAVKQLNCKKHVLVASRWRKCMVTRQPSQHDIIHSQHLVVHTSNNPSLACSPLNPLTQSRTESFTHLISSYQPCLDVVMLRNNHPIYMTVPHGGPYHITLPPPNPKYRSGVIFGVILTFTSLPNTSTFHKYVKKQVILCMTIHHITSFPTNRALVIIAAPVKGIYKCMLLAYCPCLSACYTNNPAGPLPAHQRRCHPQLNYSTMHTNACSHSICPPAHTNGYSLVSLRKTARMVSFFLNTQ